MYVQFRWCVHYDMWIIFLFMLVHYEKFKISTQIEFNIFASTMSFWECFPTINQWVNFLSKYIIAEIYTLLQVLTFLNFLQKNVLVSVIKCYLYWYKALVFLSALELLKALLIYI